MAAKSVILAIVAALASSVAAVPGEMTYYTPGLGACGWVNSDSDPVVAWSAAQFHPSLDCGRWLSIRNPQNNRTTFARLVDACAGCGTGDLDVSPAVFADIADLSVGRIEVDWHVV